MTRWLINLFSQRMVHRNYCNNELPGPFRTFRTDLMNRRFQCLTIGFLALACGTAAFGRVRLSDYFEPGLQRQLAEAGEDGDVKEIDHLLASGADVNATGKEKMTALMWALLHLNKPGFEHLLQKGANPNLSMEESKLTHDGITDGSSAVSLSARNVDPWYLETVLKYGGDPNVSNPVRQETPIFACITLQDRRAPRETEARLAQIRMLISAGANLNALNHFGNTPMIAAAWLIRYDIVHLMLEAGADPRAKSRLGRTLLNEIGDARIDQKSELFEWRKKVIALLQKQGIEITDDMPRLEGRWRLESLQQDGTGIAQPLTYYEFSYLSLRIVVDDQQPTEVLRVALDLGTKPKQMEIRGRQAPKWFDYELNGDELRLVAVEKGPAVPAANAGHHPSIIMILRRVR